MSLLGAIVAGMKGERLPDSGRLAGIVTATEFGSAGVTRARLRWLVERGVLAPLGRGLYARAAEAEDVARTPGGASALRVVAALVATGPDTVGSHRDAALIHGLDLLDRRANEPVAVTRPPDIPGSKTGRLGVRIHKAALPPDHRAVRLGAPVTSVARTVIDLARTTSFREGVVVADSALHRRKTTKADLAAVVAVCERWPGITKARKVVEFCDGRSESAFESISRVVFADGGLPPPDLQIQVGADGRVIARVDFLWRQYATIAEADGALKYADPERAKLQLQRDAELREAGFEVVHFTWPELHINPDQVLRSIRAAFARNVAVRRAVAAVAPGRSR